jgi:hypothetical protein
MMEEYAKMRRNSPTESPSNTKKKKVSFIYRVVHLIQEISNDHTKKNIGLRPLEVAFLNKPQAKFGKHSFPLCHRDFGTD